MSRGRHYRQTLCYSVRPAQKGKVLTVCAWYLVGKYKRLSVYCLFFTCPTGEGLADFTVIFNCHHKIRAVVFSSRLSRANLDFPPQRNWCVAHTKTWLLPILLALISLILHFLPDPGGYESDTLSSKLAPFFFYSFIHSLKMAILILRCVIPVVCWKTNGKVNSVRKHKYKCMLYNGIY